MIRMLAIRLPRQVIVKQALIDCTNVCGGEEPKNTCLDMRQPHLFARVHAPVHDARTHAAWHHRAGARHANAPAMVETSMTQALSRLALRLKSCVRGGAAKQSHPP